MNCLVLMVVGLAGLGVRSEPPAPQKEELARLTYFRAGEEALRTGQPAEAEKALTAALDGVTEADAFAEAYLLRGLARERLGRQAEADQDFRRGELSNRVRLWAALKCPAGDKVVAVRRSPTFPRSTDPNEPCCDLMAPAGAARPVYLEAGTAVEVVNVRKDGWVEYKVEKGTPRLVHGTALAKPIATTAPVKVRGADAGKELEQSAVAFDYLKIEVAYSKDEFRYPIRVTVTAFGTRHPALGATAAPVWTAVCSTPAEFEPVASKLADDYPFYTGQSATFDEERDEVATATTWAAYPRPHVIPVGTKGRHLLLSRTAQRDFVYWENGESSTYEAKKFGLIIQEQHNNPIGHQRQLRGLEALFADNPWLLKEKAVAFLSEGTLKGTTHDVAPLQKAVPKPAQEVVDRTLESLLLTGYLAYEWKHNAGVPTIGYEDPDLYRISAKLFTGQFANRTGARHLWWQAVIARNKTMADGLIAGLDDRECPILFMGGRHMRGLDASEEKPNWDALAGVIPEADIAVLKKWPKKGVREFLKEAGVGYTYLNVRDPLHDPYDYESTQAQYFDLFRAQEGGNLDPYLEKYTRNACPTVKPDPKAAAKAAKRADEVRAAEAAKPVDRTLRQFGLLNSGNDFARGLVHQDLAGGGHTIFKHVNQTDQYLRNRLATEKGLKAASSFPNLRTASTSVAAAINARRSDIAAWLKNPATNEKGEFTYRAPAPVGRTIERGSTNAVPASGVVIRLKPDANMPGGFRVHTAYPQK